MLRRTVFPSSLNNKILGVFVFTSSSLPSPSASSCCSELNTQVRCQSSSTSSGTNTNGIMRQIPPPSTSFEPIKDLQFILPAITGGVKIQKSPTSRSQCLLCGLNIRVDSHRFGLLVSGAGDFSFASWTHAHCFEHVVPLCYPKEAISTLAKYQGLSLVPRSVIDTVLRVVTGSPQASVVSLLGQKLADEIASQSLRLQEKIDFFSKIETDVLVDFLKHNYPNAHADTFSKGRRIAERAAVINFAAESATFGCGPECTTCNNGGIFIPSSSAPLRYHCSGHLDEFTSCWGKFDREDMPRVRSFDIATPLEAAKAAVASGQTPNKKNAPFVNLIAPPVDLSPPPYISVEKRLQDAIANICSSSSSPLLLQQNSKPTPLAGCSFFVLNPPEASSSSSSSSSSSRRNKNSKRSSSVSAAGIPYHGSVSKAVNECKEIIEELGGSVVTKTEAESRPTEVLIVHPSVEGKGVFSPTQASDSVLPASCKTASTIVSLQWLRDCKKHGRRILALESAVVYGMNLHYISGAPDQTARLKIYDEVKEKFAAVAARNDSASATSTAASSTQSSSSQQNNNNSSNSTNNNNINKSSEISVVGAIPVDPESGLTSTHKVHNYQNNNSDVYYSATLVKSDLTGSKNSSYIMQLLEKHNLNNAAAATPTSSTSTFTASSQVSLIPSQDKLHVMQSAAYVIWKRFGRVGDTAGNASTFHTYSDIRKARLEFEKTFKARTGNVWMSPSGKFVKKPGHYNWLEGTVAAEEKLKKTTKGKGGKNDDGNNNNDGGNGKKKSSSGGDGSGDDNNNSNNGVFDNHPVIIHKATRDLVSRLFDEKIMVDTMMTMKIDVQKMPLVTLRTETLEHGKKVLDELVKLVQEKEEEEKKNNSNNTSSTSASSLPTTIASPSPSVSTSSPLMTKIILASNRFNSVIPRIADRGKEFEQLLIDTSEKIAAQAQLLSDLSDILLTRELSLTSSAFGDPLLSKFLGLDLGMVPLDLNLVNESSTAANIDAERKYEIEEVQHIVQYFHNTQGHTHSKYKLHNVWRIERKQEVTRFKPFEKEGAKNMLLWHGSRFVNAIRILKEGFLIAPTGAVLTGSMFNDGVYNALAMSKAGNYAQLSSYATAKNPTGLMWLNEIAVGNPTIRTSSDSRLTLKKGEDSCFAEGEHTPDPKGFVIDSKHGYTIPAGKLIRRKISTSLIYDEVIVYDIARVKQRYLVEVSLA